jgi:hypothetical protein
MFQPRRLDTFEVEREQERFWELCRLRLVPYAANPCLSLVWPSDHQYARLIPEGINPLHDEVGFSHERSLERFFEVCSPNGIIAWDLNAPHYGTFAGPYSLQMRAWLSKKMLHGPICALSADSDVTLVANHDLRFTVIGVSNQWAQTLDDCFGGKEALEAEFEAHLARGDFGRGLVDVDWVRKYLKN